MYNISIKNNKKADIKENMFGLFFEDINYAADGGIYCEMLENYNFEALKAWGDWNDYHTEYDGLYGWEAYPYDGTGAILETGCGDGISSVNSHYLVFTASEEQLGFSNKAYDGVYINSGESYKISLYMRRRDYNGAVYAIIDDLGEEAERICLAEPGGACGWQKLEKEFTAKSTVTGGTFAIALEEPGRAEFDFISLKPLNAVKGIFRRDLADRLKALEPGFLRFPGGCIVEGNNLENRYQWKNSVGRLEDRKNNWNRWAVHCNNKENDFVGPYSHYNQTLGLGYYEYFLLCEYLECEPLPVANVGLACQFMSTELVEPDSPEFQEFIQDAIDLIEFANGSEDTRWGKVRCNMGHIEPFNLKMIGIGNEQWETEAVHFFDRYDAFEKAIHKVYPNMILIGSAGPDVRCEHYDDAWKYFRSKAAELGEDIGKYVYAVDEHYYKNPEWMLENSHFYDDYPRDIKVFAGEYATHTVSATFNNPSANNLYAALCEGAFMTGLERNADVVVLASYAPLFARMDYTQWSPDMIWFDGASSYGTPSYYVQQFYSVYRGKYTVELECGGDVYACASYDDGKHTLYVKLVNVTDEAMDIKLELSGFGINENVKGREIVLTGETKEDYNSLEEPDKVAPVEREIELKDCYKLGKNSLAVLCLNV